MLNDYVKIEVSICVFLLCFKGLDIKSRASLILGKQSTTNPFPAPSDVVSFVIITLPLSCMVLFSTDSHINGNYIYIFILYTLNITHMYIY